MTREGSLWVLTTAKSEILNTGHVLALAVSSDDKCLVSLCCKHSLHVHVDPLYDCHFVAMITPDVAMVTPTVAMVMILHALHDEV